MTSVRRGEVRRRGLNDAVTRFWGLAAPVYDLRIPQRWIYRPAQDEMVALLRARGAQRIADIACGTGILADRIERELHPAQVWGVDMSDGMLAQAKARSNQVSWLKGPAEQLPFDDGSLDAVVTTTAFHFFDQPAALLEFHRVLAPGGVAAVSTINPTPPLRLPGLPGLPGGRYQPAHHPAPAELRALFETAGLPVSDQHRVHRPNWTRIFPDLVTVGDKPG